MGRFLGFFGAFIVLFFMLSFQGSVDHLKLGDKYLREGKVSFAREEYRRAASSGKVSREVVAERLKKIDYMNREDQVHFNAAMAYDKIGDFEKAIGEYRRSLSINGSNPEAWKKLAHDLFRSGKDAEGSEALARLTALGVENAETNYLRALYEYRRGNVEQSASWLSRCFMLDRGHIEGRDLQALIAKRQNEARLRKAMNAREFFNNGVRRLKNREFKAAAIDFNDSAASCLPDEKGGVPKEAMYKKVPLIEDYSRTAVFFNLASACEGMGNYEEAVAALEKVIEASGASAYVYQRIGENYRRSENDAEAYKAFQKAAMADGSFPDIHSRLGFAARRTGKYEEAIGHFRTATEHDPQNPLNYYNLAIMYKKLDRLEAAGETFEKALSMTAGDSNLRYLIMEQVNLVKTILGNKTARK